MHSSFMGGTVEREPDWEREERGYRRCGSCGLAEWITSAQREPTDAHSNCPSCATPTQHPAAADLARCLTCGLLYRVRLVPSVVRVRHGLTRVAFDGWTVTLTRLWCLVPRWRHRRIALDRIVRTEYLRPVEDPGKEVSSRFVVHLRHGDGRRVLRLGVPRQLYNRVRNQRFMAMNTMINEAVTGRIRLLLKDSVGLGPWSEAEWEPNEQLLPELRGLAEGPMHRRSRSHREMTDQFLCAMRGEEDSRIAGWPRPVPGLPSLDLEPFASGLGRRDSDVWLAVADRLAATCEVRATTGWRLAMAVQLSYGQHWSTVIRRGTSY